MVYSDFEITERDCRRRRNLSDRDAVLKDIRHERVDTDARLSICESNFHRFEEHVVDAVEVMPDQQLGCSVVFAMVALRWEREIRVGTPTLQEAHGLTIGSNTKNGWSRRVVSSEAERGIERAVQSQNRGLVGTDGYDACNALLWRFGEPPRGLRTLVG